MSDSEDDLFGASSDGGDTDELFAASKDKKKPIATKKSGAAKKPKTINRLKKKIPDADNDDDDDDDAADGLFDSDDEEDKVSAKSKKAKAAAAKPMTKREKMEALKKKARKAAGLSDEKKVKRTKDSSKRSESKGPDDKEYDSQNSYDSGTEYQRTKEDDDFIDVEGEDEDVVREYYKEQIFDDERPDDEELDVPKKGKKGSKGGSRKRGPDALSAEDEKDENNPIMAAVRRMKKKKKVVKSFEEKIDAAQEFVRMMELAADEDDLAIKERRPGMKKLQMLSQAVDMMTNREMIRPLLESDVLSVVKRWIQPLPNGSLGNVTVRQQMIDVIAKMGTGEEHGIDTDDLKKSGFGKLVMTLYMHKKETPTMKAHLKKLIEEWSRTIFKKSGNMRDLASAQSRRRNTGLTGFARTQAAYRQQEEQERAANAAVNSPDKKRSNADGDIGSVISQGVKQARDMGKNRVRIPYSKGFQYSIRPSDVTGDVTDKKTRISTVRDGRSSLHKTMLEKKRPVNKNNRSANMSIEGRPTK